MEIMLLFNGLMEFLHVISYRPSDDLDSILPYRIPKQMELMEGGGDYDFGLGLSGQPSIRDQEYLQHSSLWGHKYISGKIYLRICRLSIRLMRFIYHLAVN